MLVYKVSTLFLTKLPISIQAPQPYRFSQSKLTRDLASCKTTPFNYSDNDLDLWTGSSDCSIAITTLTARSRERPVIVGYFRFYRAVARDIPSGQTTMRQGSRDGEPPQDTPWPSRSQQPQWWSPCHMLILRKTNVLCHLDSNGARNL